MINVDKIYVIHYTKLINRKIYLDNFFAKNNIEANYITEYDKEYLTEEIIKKYYDKSDIEYKNKIGRVYGSGCVPRFDLKPAELSCTVKHCLALEDIYNSNNEINLILEDDVIFLDNFVDNFNNFLKKTPDDWDIIYIGDGAGLRVVKPQNNIVAYKKQHPASKCADSFIIKKTLANKIYKTIIPFNTIIDWQYSFELYLHNANVYWWHPNVVTQGSEKGMYKSELR